MLQPLTIQLHDNWSKFLKGKNAKSLHLIIREVFSAVTFHHYLITTVTSLGVIFYNKTWIDYSAYRIDLPSLGPGSAVGEKGKKRGQIGNYSTWQSMRLSLPKVKQNLGERTFLFTGAKFFNKLALDIVKGDKI